MSDGLVKRLRTVDISWSEVGEWCGEAADLLEECERAMREVERLVLGANHSQTRYPYFLTMLAKLRAAKEKVDE